MFLLPRARPWVPRLIHHRGELSGTRREAARPEEGRHERPRGLRPGAFLAQLRGRRGLLRRRAAPGTPLGRRAAWPKGNGVHGPVPRLQCPLLPSGPRRGPPRVPSPRTHRGLRHGDPDTCADVAWRGEAVVKVGKRFLSSFLKADAPVPPPCLRSPHLSCRPVPSPGSGRELPPGPGTILSPEILRDPPPSLSSTRIRLLGRSWGGAASLSREP